MHWLRNLRVRLHTGKRRRYLEPNEIQNPSCPHGAAFQFCTYHAEHAKMLDALKHVQKMRSSQSEETGLLIIDEKKCKGCDWCVQACEHGGITINCDTGKAIACDLCQGEPKCVEACPEEALEIVDSDEAAEKRFNDALEKLPAQTEQLTITVKNKDWKPLVSSCRETI